VTRRPPDGAAPKSTEPACRSSIARTIERPSPCPPRAVTTLVDAEEPLAEPGQGLGRDAGALVLDDDDRGAPVAPHVDADAPRGGRVATRVLQQVRDRLVEAQRVADDPHVLALHVDRRAGCVGEARDGRGDDLGDVDGLAHERHVRIVELGEVADVFDEARDAERLALERREQPRSPIVVRGERPVRERVAEAEQRGRGRGELVREIGEEPPALRVCMGHPSQRAIELATHRLERLADAEDVAREVEARVDGARAELAARELAHRFAQAERLAADDEREDDRRREHRDHDRPEDVDEDRARVEAHAGRGEQGDLDVRDDRRQRERHQRRALRGAEHHHAAPLHR
jgi:hypothetical protein